MRRFASVFMACALASSCGGKDKGAEESTGDLSEEEDDLDEGEGEGEELIPEVKFEEIRHTFERKAKTVAPCFPEAVDAGELDQNDRVKLSLGLTITEQGKPADLEILGTSKRSKTLESCVKTNVSRWEFTTLPHSIKYSYSFVLQRF